MATSQLERLPTELLDAILEHLTRRGLAHLSACSKTLRRRVEPTLYRGLGSWRESRAISWGLARGYQTVVMKAITYGGAIPRRCCYVFLELLKKRLLRVFRMLWKKGCWSPKTPTWHYGSWRGGTVFFSPRVKTDNHWRLYCDYGCLEGAGMEMISLASTPACRPFMRTMLEYPSTSMHCGGVAIADLFLANILQRPDATFDLVHYVLDHGANPYRMQGTHHASSCPLVMAMLNRAEPEIFDLLLARGASIHGRRFHPGPDRPSHIPIFMAAHLMADLGLERSWMLKCLKHGAMINHTACILHQHRRGRGTDKTAQKHYIAFPIYAFLDSYSKWTLQPPSPKIGPIDGIKFWLDRGVVIGADGIPDSGGTARPIYRGIMLRPLACFLIDKFGIGKLADDDFFAVIKYLAGFGVDSNHVLDMLRESHEEYLQASEVVQQRWEEVLGMVGFDYGLWSAAIASEI
ncbi:uncharacterized protein B0I36DRAFT_335172 [Microdochium trichocladiopsis]|uniref:F-box domain-containing protein n=1 Tax=Microdochium trichocladiopsis TaxID=1682393 RepID=A0A9P9BJD0_9PEZI|nr:uncharacterized protein B0I36DRAFT_335172 [Microdochium trichocladiopsis]KAH7018018.1 hypothetical protein B0I36DRAFT_335172 [Microdochium trichocladiopsis]